jgi:hypothetical protein
MAITEAKRSLRHRLEEVFREIGVLLLVFTPIDMILAADTPRRLQRLLILFGLDAFFLGGALIAEFRRLHGD